MKLPVLVLAGGLATRLGSITEKTPKSLIPINSIPFVFHQLQIFNRNNVQHVHFCLGHFGEMLKAEVEKSTFAKKMKITFSFDGEKLLGTGGAVKKAFPLLPDDFFITYGDSYLDIDYNAVENHFLNNARPNSGLMTVFKNSNQYDTSNVVFKNGEIVLYSKKHLNSDMNYIDYGLGILRKSHFLEKNDQTPFDLSEIYEELSMEGNLLWYEAMHRFFEIGSIKGIDDLSNYLKTK